MTDFVAALNSGPLVADAAMGTRLIARGLNLHTDDPALWNLARPGIVANTHAADVAAGADVLLTNTFGANRTRLTALGRASFLVEINRAAVELARRAAGAARFVLGDLGPLAAAERAILLEQARALRDAGVDGLILETAAYEASMKALVWLREAVSCPVVVSLVGRPFGESENRPRDWAAALERAGAAAVGNNCGTLEAVAEDLATAACALPRVAKPSGLLRREVAGTPDVFAAQVAGWLDAGARLIGGCCGTTEAHVAAVRGAVDRWRAPAPRHTART